MLNWSSFVCAAIVPTVMVAVCCIGPTIAAGESGPETRLAAADANFGAADVVGELIRSTPSTVGDCRSCHVITGELNHPVGLTASMPVPRHLPLKRGRLTCVTCHSTSAYAHRDAQAGKGAMLRTGPNGPVRCIDCHSEIDEKTQLGHAVALGRAHLFADHARFGAAARGLGGLDAESQTCMGCHDGSRGKGLGVSHPVGVAYDELSLSRPSDSRLTPRHTLDARVRLFGGNVGCGSCHSVYSTQPKMVPMPNTRSQLCKSCHASQ